MTACPWCSRSCAARVVGIEQIFVADDLGFTRDPFDALIVATAITMDLPLVTRDIVVRESAVVRVLW